VTTGLPGQNLAPDWRPSTGELQLRLGQPRIILRYGWLPDASLPHTRSGLSRHNL
jgi:hypothetical protein